MEVRPSVVHGRTSCQATCRSRSAHQPCRRRLSGQAVGRMSHDGDCIVLVSSSSDAESADGSEMICSSPCGTSQGEDAPQGEGIDDASMDLESGSEIAIWSPPDDDVDIVLPCPGSPSSPGDYVDGSSMCLPRHSESSQSDGVDDTSSSHIEVDDDGSTWEAAVDFSARTWGTAHPASSWDAVGPVQDARANLYILVDRMVRRLQDEFRRLRPGKIELRSASLCAGTGCTHQIMDAISRVLAARRLLSVSHNAVLYCESQAYKQRFIKQHSEDPSPLILPDVTALGGPQVVDWTGACCSLPTRVDIIFGSPVCKALSTLNGSRLQLLPSESLSTPMGIQSSTGSTFAGVVRYMKVSTAKLAILEMVTGLRHRSSGHDAGRRNELAWQEGVETAGFECVLIRLVAAEFFLPQMRPRIYTIAASPSRCGMSVADVSAKLENTRLRIEQLGDTSQMLPLSAFWLPFDHPVVQRMKVDLERKFPAIRQPCAPQGCGALRGRTPKWVEVHRQTYEKYGLSWLEPVLHETGSGMCGYRPDLESTNVFYRALSDRRKHMLEFMWWRFGDPPTVHVPWDLHESLSWLVAHVDAQTRTWHGPPCVRTITPDAFLWCAFLQPQRPVSGTEKMLLQGLPVERGSWTQAQLSDLAGNGFATPVVAAIVLCLLAEFYDVLAPSRDTAGGSNAAASSSTST